MCALATGVLLRNPLAALGQDGARAKPNVEHRVPYQVTTEPLFYFTRETFEPYVGGIFTARGSDGRKVLLTLVSVSVYTPASYTRLTSRPPYQQTDSFSLHFRAERALSQLAATHTLTHGALGEFDLFMTETRVRDTWNYEAVINHVNS